jgi:hypothetical protein
MDVQPEIRPEVTRKVWKTTDVTDGFPRWHLTQTPYNWMLDSTRRVPQRPDALPFCIRVIRAIRGEFYFGAGSRLLFLAEFLETRIIPERIEHWIEPEHRGSEPARRETTVRDREEFL